jgi:hypothetical protein
VGARKPKHVLRECQAEVLNYRGVPATLRYGLPYRSRVPLTVFNTLSQEVATLVKGEKDAGNHQVNSMPWGFPAGSISGS